MDLNQINRLQAKAVMNGAARRSVTHTEWDVSADCEKPQTLELFGRASVRGHKNVMPLFDGASKTVVMHTRCRHCRKCLRVRQLSWAYRANQELSWSTRTWFCTFTLSPQEQYSARLKTFEKLSNSGVDQTTLSQAELFQETHTLIAKTFTKMFKRIRKNTGVKFRYLLVVEKHKSGDPHYHALIHEFAGEITKRQIQNEWKLGFSVVKLVAKQDEEFEDSNPAWYVCKYLGKEASARIRASEQYGRTFHLSKALDALNTQIDLHSE